MPKNPHANFTPVLDGYSGIGAFRFWCQTALPLTYDDSLSYYELLCKVVNYLNHAIEDLSNVEENTDKLAEAYTKLQNYVNEYFDKLDIEEELKNILDTMAQDGTLDALLDPLVTNHLPGVVDDKIDAVVANQIDDAVAGQIDETVAEQLPAVVAADIPAEVTNWLTANVNPVGSAVAVDSSLSISGAAADAKVTGSKISDLKTQLNVLFTDLPPITFVQGTINSTYGRYDPNNKNRIASDSYIDVTNKTVFDIPTVYDYSLFFYKGRVEVAASNYLSTSGWLNGTKTLGDTIQIPETATLYKIVIKYHDGNTIPIGPSDFSDYQIKIPGYYDIKTELESDINATKTELESDINDAKTELDYKIKNTDVIESRTLINGNINSTYGTIDTNSTVRLVTKYPFLIEPNLSVKIADNFESAVFFYKVPKATSGSYISNSGWINGNYTLGEDVAIPDAAEYAWISIRNKAKPSSTIAPSDVTNDDFIVWRTYEKLDANNVSEYAIGLSATPNITFLCRDGMATVDVPPNSKFAIKATAENQYDKIRFSVNKTYDGYYVCVHDRTINNLAVNTDGTAISDPVSVRESTLAQLNSYDWGLKYGEEYAGLHVPELEDCIAWASKYGLTIALDIKFSGDVSDDDVNNISTLLSKYAQLETIFFAINITTMQKFYAKSKKFSYLYAGELASITNAIKNDLVNLHSAYNKIYLANRPMGSAPDSAYISFAMENDFDIMYSPIEGLNALKTLGFDKGVSLMECHYIPNIKNSVRNYANSLMQD